MTSIKSQRNKAARSLTPAQKKLEEKLKIDKRKAVIRKAQNKFLKNNKRFILATKKVD